MDETVAFIGVGANLGDRAGQLAIALQALSRTHRLQVEAVSRLRETAPVGPPQPDYLNGVARVRTSLGPHALLDRLLGVEAELGRVRTVRFGPRTVDLDLLLYGQWIIRSSRLVVPHPRMTERRFVLEPLVELAPRANHPLLNVPFQVLLQALTEPVGGG